MSNQSLGDAKPYKTKDGLWRAAFHLGYDGQGRPVRRVVSSKSRNECIRKRNELRRKIEDGENLTTDKTTVEQWLTRWLDEIAKPRIRPRVWLTYGSAIRNNITPHIGAYKLQKLTPANVREMHRAVAKAGKSSRTAEIAHNILARSLTDAVREGILTKNVCDLVDKPKVTMKSRGNLTSEQARTLLRVSASKRDPMVARWAMALMTGARQGECLGLQWERVDFERNLIDLSWQLQRIPKRHGCGDPGPTTGLFKCGKHPRRPASCPQAVWDVEPGFEMIPLDRGQLALTRPKTTKSIRVVPMVAPLAEALRRHRETTEPNPFDLVWVGENSGPIGPREDYEAWDDALSRAELPDVPLHAARHTTATLLLEAGVDPMVIAQILGHVSILTTQQYAHVDQTLARQALGKLDGLIDFAALPTA
ncbi:tyrosine-type recombinase/integrase [Rhodococcus hoagii]|nr:tyrosine-type recombinase/integrase [Prescottella equi]